MPIGAALLADAVFRSVPGVGALVALITEPAGAAAGVAYLMTLVLSSPSVDPKTLAPSGTVLNAKKARQERLFDPFHGCFEAVWFRALLRWR